MNLKNWIILSLVAVLLYGAVVFIAPRLAAQSGPNGDAPSLQDSPIHSSEEFEVELPGPPQASTTHFAPEPVSLTPHFIETPVITASLDALKAHGADLSKPMPSTHRVRCESNIAIDAISEWAKTVGFEVSEPETVHLHGGIPNYMVDLVKVEIPDLSSIQQQGQQIAEKTAEINGVTYATWVGAIVK